MPFLLFVLMSLSAFAGSRDNLLSIKSDFCVCKDGQAVSYGNCASFCADEMTNGAEILFTSFTIAENKKYKTVYEWCTKKDFWDFRNPKCVMTFKDESGNTTELDVVATDNIVKADVTSLNFDKVFVFNLRETVSKAVSNQAQLLKYNPQIPLPLPLQTRMNGDYGIWPTTNPLFYDNNGNGYLDVHDMIRQQVKRFGGSIPMGSQIFSHFPLVGDFFTMAPFIDQTTFYSYCPDESHYNSNVPLYLALREVVGHPTEGLYGAADETGNKIFLSESDIKSVWFYLKNGQPKVPNDETVSRVTVYFFYPLDKVDPYTKKPNQKTFKVLSALELGMNSNSTTNGGTISTYPTHDRKLACIPKI